MSVGEGLVLFVALYPICTAALWVAGGLVFHWRDEPTSADEPEGGWPGVSVLIPAYNEEAVIAISVRAALDADYPELEVLVLDDGSTDDTDSVAREAGAGDPRLRVLRDPVNRGKAERLNVGLREAHHELVAVTDADAHMHPQALKLLVTRLSRSPVVAAVAGAPHVTNRGHLLLAMQVLEAASIIGLIRRTQALTGRVGVVAGVLALFRRDRVLAVGGYDGRMATEDIDLTWRLVLAGWETLYEPHALVGMQVPSTLGALWTQRKRWARGQGEVLHVHLTQAMRFRNRRMWLLALESVASLIWVIALAVALIFAVASLAIDADDVFGFSLAWGIGIAMVATLQLIVALSLERRYDHTIWRAFTVAALYPLLYWILAALAALRAQTVALVRGPQRHAVVWDIPRERLEPR